MNSPTAANKNGYLLSISIIGALFFIFGFVTWLNGILIPYLQISCELTNFQAVFVAFADQMSDKYPQSNGRTAPPAIAIIINAEPNFKKRPRL